MNEINCIKKDRSLIHVTKYFLDLGIIALNFAGEDRGRRHSLIHILLAFDEITHLKGLNSCNIFCVECNNINF